MKKLLLTIFGAVLLSVGLMAQTITPVPPGGTWSTARGIINANDEIASDSMAILQSLKAPLASPTFTGTVSLPATWRVNAVTVTSNAAELNILDGALCSFTELNYLVGVSSAIQTQLNNRLLKSDTAAMLAPYALTSEIGAGAGDVMRSDSLVVFVTPTQLSDSLAGAGVGVTISDVRNEIADSLNVLRPLYTAVADTATMLTNYTLSSEVSADTTILHNYFESRVDSIVSALGDTTDIETLLQINFDTDTLADLSELRLKLDIADSVNYANGYMSRYDGVTGLSAKPDIEDVRLLVDTVPIFIFGAGGANEVDTACFTTSTVYGGFYNSGSDTIRVTELRAVMVAGTTPLGTDTLSIQVYWNDSINVTGGGAVTLNSSALGINSVTTGTVDTSFSNAKIPPGVWVFMRSPGIVTGRKPKMLLVTLTGYKIPRY